MDVNTKLLRDRLKNTKMLIMDADGVLTDGKIILGSSGEELKVFNVQDGLGISLANKAGLIVAVISGRKSKALENRANELNIKEFYQGIEDKSIIYKRLKEKYHVLNEEVVYIGDDLTDLEVMEQVGIPISVNNAVKKVKEVSNYVTRKSGGEGAVREVIELILTAKGRNAPKIEEAGVSTKDRNKEVIAIIPSRYDSTRLPGKALVDICGKPMIQHVYEKAMKASLVDDVIVATDDERIFEAVTKFKGKAVMTLKTHNTGTDRVAEVAQKLDGAEIIVNIQGDEPLIEPRMVDQAIEPLIENRDILVCTLKQKIKDENEYNDPNVVKVVTNKNNDALYFSRSLIPYPRKKEQAIYKHIGLYAYQKPFLLKLAKMPQTYLEKQESLEQLRILDYGYNVKVVETEYQSIGVDTKEDLDKVRSIMTEKLKLRDEND